MNCGVKSLLESGIVHAYHLGFQETEHGHSPELHNKYEASPDCMRLWREGSPKLTSEQTERPKPSILVNIKHK